MLPDVARDRAQMTHRKESSVFGSQGLGCLRGANFALGLGKTENCLPDDEMCDVVSATRLRAGDPRVEDGAE